MQSPKLTLVVLSRGLEDLIERNKDHIRGAKSPATLCAYKSGFEDFVRFYRDHNDRHEKEIPPGLYEQNETVGKQIKRYLAAHARTNPDPDHRARW